MSRMYMTNISKEEQLSDLFQKTCINAYLATKYKDGKLIPQSYRREDLSEWAEEFCKQGKKFFYAEPVNPDHPYGKLKLCEPKYVYTLKRSLTEEEYTRLVKGE